MGKLGKAEERRGSAKAKAVLKLFPGSAQRDCFEWICKAKQDSTRTKRIATAFQWLCEGKRRYWKYHN